MTHFTERTFSLEDGRVFSGILLGALQPLGRVTWGILGEPLSFSLSHRQVRDLPTQEFATSL